MQCITSIEQATKDYELIIIDNNSDKETREYIDLLKPDILIRNPENLGVAAAWNQGIRLATTDKYLILNSDVVVAKGWFLPIIRALDREEILYAQPGHTSQGIRDDFFETAAKIAEEERDPVVTNVMNGFCFGIKKETIEKIGYFDEDFIVWVDKDYDKRLHDKEYEKWEVPNVHIHHFESQTLKALMIEGMEWDDHDKEAWAKKWDLSGQEKF